LVLRTQLGYARLSAPRTLCVLRYKKEISPPRESKKKAIQMDGFLFAKEQ